MRHFALVKCQKCDGITRYNHRDWNCQNCLWFGLEEKPVVFKTIIRLRGDDAADPLEMLAGGSVDAAARYLLESTDTYETVSDVAPWHTGSRVERLENDMYLFASYNLGLIGIAQVLSAGEGV